MKKILVLVLVAFMAVNVFAGENKVVSYAGENFVNNNTTFYRVAKVLNGKSITGYNKETCKKVTDMYVEEVNSGDVLVVIDFIEHTTNIAAGNTLYELEGINLLFDTLKKTYVAYMNGKYWDTDGCKSVTKVNEDNDELLAGRNHLQHMMYSALAEKPAVVAKQ